MVTASQHSPENDPAGSNSNDARPPGACPAFDPPQRAAVYRAITSRRDVRRGFLHDPLPAQLVTRLLAAAHNAPSVGLMQPSRFLLIRSLATRTRVHAAFEAANQQALASYQGERAEQYAALKLEAILEAPQNLCVVCDPQSAQGHGLGRHTMPEAALYSTICAVQNLWLAARAEGVGVGWVSILCPQALRTILGIPPAVTPVAYLCLGYVNSFGSAPELEQLGWEQRTPLDSVFFHETYPGGEHP